MPPIATNYEIRANLFGAIGCPYLHACDFFFLLDQTGHFVLHPELEAGKTLGFPGEKVEKVPLRHEGNKLAMSRNALEIGSLEIKVPNHAGNGAVSLMRQL